MKQQKLNGVDKRVVATAQTNGDAPKNLECRIADYAPPKIFIFVPPIVLGYQYFPLIFHRP